MLLVSANRLCYRAAHVERRDRAEFEADACVLVTRMAMDVFRRRLIGDSTAG